MMFQTHQLENGLRIVCAHSQSDVVYCGLAVDAGTRDENADESGVAHFAEHLSFKGTTHRSARQIITRMESVGGDLNAFTGKEETVFYCTLLRQHLSRAIDLLLDIALCSTFPQHEMDHEVEVVIDEIESYNDQPAELIYDEFEAILFPSHPLGRNILGSPERLRQLRSSDMQRYARRLFVPARMVLFVYGRTDIDKVLRMVNRSPALQQYAAHTNSLSEKACPRVPAMAIPDETPRVTTRARNCHQAHVMIGCRTFAATDERHLDLFLLNNLLGGPAMSSRLNLALRERNGLVYTVESNQVGYTDSGFWSTYFGCDHHDVERCRRLVLHELRRLTEAPLSQRTLEAARRQLKGQLGVSFDNSENVAIGMGKRFLHYHRTQSMEQIFQRLDTLTPEHLWETAREVFAPERLITLIYT